MCKYVMLILTVSLFENVCLYDMFMFFCCRRVQQCSQCASAALPLSVVKERHLAVAVTLWTHFLPFLRTLRLSQTPPEELAHAAAGQISYLVWYNVMCTSWKLSCSVDNKRSFVMVVMDIK